MSTKILTKIHNWLKDMNITSYVILEDINRKYYISLKSKILGFIFSTKCGKIW